MPFQPGIISSRRRVTVVAGVLPTTSGALHTRYDAQQETATNGATITTITDRSGNAFTATAAGTGLITMDTAGLNGFRTYDFPASGTAWADTGTFATILSTTIIHVFIVAKFVNIAGNQAIIASTTSTSLKVGSSSGPYSAVRGGTAMAGGTVDANPHRLHLFSPASGAATATLDLDATTIAGPAGIASSAQTAWRVGSNAGGQQFRGNIGEILIYTGALTTTDVTNVDNYLKTKWGF